MTNYEAYWQRLLQWCEEHQEYLDYLTKEEGYDRFIPND